MCTDFISLLNQKSPAKHLFARLLSIDFNYTYRSLLIPFNNRLSKKYSGLIAFPFI